MSKYNISPFLSEEEKNVCCNAVSIPEEGAPHNCVEEWIKNLKTATHDYEEARAKADGAEGIYNNSFMWESKLKKWIDNAHAAHLKASEIYIELDLFIKVVSTTEHHTRQTSKTLQALLCLVKKIFNAINLLLQNSVNSTDPKGLLQKLKDYIECLKTLDDQKKKDALDCISNYETKVQAIYELQADILNKMMEALHASNILATTMGNGKNGQDFGLKWQLLDLKSRIIGIHAADKKQEDLTNSPCFKPSPKPTPPCGIAILNASSKLLPIEEFNDNGTILTSNDYFQQLSKLYNTAHQESEHFKAIMTKAREQRDKIEAKKNSLTEAIKASTAASPAK